MSLTHKEVRNPVPTRRAEKILACLLSGGTHGEYNDAGAIDISDSVAMLDGTVDAQAMTLADEVVPGAAMRLECRSLDEGVDSIVLTPATLNGGTTLTFNAVGDFVILIWVVTVGWTPRANSAVLA
jgi:hypothetical protein